MKLIDSLGCEVGVGDKVRWYMNGQCCGFGWAKKVSTGGALVRTLEGGEFSARVGAAGEPTDTIEARLFGPHDQDAE